MLVGINLLSEGLDLPEVSLVAILDADKEGFLRSETSLIQTIGRAARNVDGQVIMYADRMTDSMQRAISETHRRRASSRPTTPSTASTLRPSARRSPTSWCCSARARNAPVPGPDRRSRRRDQARSDLAELPHDELARLIPTLEEEMREAAADLRFEYAARSATRYKTSSPNSGTRWPAQPLTAVRLFQARCCPDGVIQTPSSSITRVVRSQVR